MFKCNLCEYKAKKRSSLKTHNNAVHLKLKPFKCDKCEKTFSSNGHLRAHKKIHSKPKPFECETCNEKFSYRCNLTNHIHDYHPNMKPFKCKLCDTKLESNGGLKNHINAVHLKLKPFKCDKCYMKFSSKGKLQSHINSVHLNIRNHECDKCDMKFHTNGKLQSHIDAVHLNIRNHECDKCDMKFSTIRNLQRHIKTHETKLKCSSGEAEVMKILDSMKVKYLFDQQFDELKDKNYLRWDFRIPTDGEPLFIEYDGKQHYDSIPFFGGDEKLKETQRRDKIKTDYCDNKGYMLLRIKYSDFKNISKLVSDFIIQNTSWF